MANPKEQPKTYYNPDTRQMITPAEYEQLTPEQKIKIETNEKRIRDLLLGTQNQGRGKVLRRVN